MLSTKDAQQYVAQIPDLRVVRLAVEKVLERDQAELAEQHPEFYRGMAQGLVFVLQLVAQDGNPAWVSNVITGFFRDACQRWIAAEVEPSVVKTE